jgi:hypothetical protein
MLNPDQIIKNAAQIYEKLGRAYHFDDGLKSNQVRAAIIAICEEINKQRKEISQNHERYRNLDHIPIN